MSSVSLRLNNPNAQCMLSINHLRLTHLSASWKTNHTNQAKISDSHFSCTSCDSCLLQYLSHGIFTLNSFYYFFVYFYFAAFSYISYFSKIDIPENVDAREDTTAEDILRRCSNDMLKPMLTTTNSKGSKGAPSHPVASQS